MSTQVTTASIQQYKKNFDILSQQRGSKLEKAVRVEMVEGKYGFFDQLDATTVSEISSRHADTTLTSTVHARRRVGLANYGWADMIDELDVPLIGRNPKDKYTQNAVYAFGRKKDEILLTAASGTAYTGETGATSTSFAAGNVVTASGGLTIEKLLEAKYTLDSLDVDPQLDRYFVCHPYQIRELLNLTEVKSSDYNTIKALAKGEVNSFMGFTFIPTNLTSKSGSTRACYAWAEGAMLLAVGKDISVKVDERADKWNGLQIAVKMRVGATRMDEDKIVRIDCVES
jgi:hypothetical protein